MRVATTSSMSDTEEYTGQVYAFNIKLDIVILMKPVVSDGYEELPAPLRPAISHRVQILSASKVVSVENINPPGTISFHPAPLVKPIKLERLLRREQKALEKRQAQFQSRAPMRASSEALAIFSALIKTYLNLC